MRKILLTVSIIYLLQPMGLLAAPKPFIKRGQADKSNKWELVYHERFLSESTIEKNWDPQNASPDHILSSRWRENLHIKAGKLRISNRKEKRGGKEWTSGSMTGKKLGFGYYECKMKISKATGVNNSFWLFAGSKPGNHAFEIDFAEVHYPNIINYTVHDWGGEGLIANPVQTYVYRPDVDLSAKYHIYGCDWDEDRISFYFDGELIWQAENQVCDRNGLIVLGAAILGWAGQVTEAIDGTDMRVDYVRVWAKKR